MEAVAALAGSSGGLTGQFMQIAGQLGSSLGAATIQSNSARELQDRQINYNQSQQQRALESYRQAGLPDFMYWSGSQTNTPNSKFYVGGENYIASSGVNTNLPYYTSGHPFQQFMNMGRPNPNTNRDTKALPQQKDYIKPNPYLRTGAQFDRAGLGTGRFVQGDQDQTAVKQTYNQVPPPSNSAGTQTRTQYQNRYTQIAPQTTDRFAQTKVSLGGGNSLIGK